MTVGDKFGKMTVIGRTRKKVVAQCECGNERTYSYTMLRAKATSKYDGCSECAKVKLRLSATNDPTYKSRRVYQMYRRTAQVRNIHFELTQNDVQTLIFEPCHYCGKSPSNN